MKKIISTTALLIVASAFANAGTPFYWVQSTDSNSFGATKTDDTTTVSNWRYEQSTSTYYYVTPKKYDSVSLALEESDKATNWKIASTVSPTGLDLSDGLDLTIGGVASGTTINVDGVYAVNGLTPNYYTSGNATLDFGTSGALFTYYTLNLTGVKLTVDLSNATSTATTRILCGVATDGSSTLKLVNSESETESDKTLSLTADGFTSLGQYTDEATAKAAVDAASGSAFAWFTSSISGQSNNALQIVYATKAIPEPSAFGLLAGIGALALAISRRKRRK